MHLSRSRIAIVVLIVAVAVTISSCTFGRLLKYNYSGVDDYKIFPERPLRASTEPWRFPEDFDTGLVPERITFDGRVDVSLDDLLAENDTLAFLVIKNDVLVAERYYNGHDRAARSLSFSMAKSFTSILIGCAIRDGLIGDVRDPVSRYVPELADAGFDRVTIEHLMQMTAGVRYKESDSLLRKHPYWYYADNLEERLLRLKLKREPGTKWEYSSGENMLLALILKRVLAPRTITDYTQDKLWSPLGAEYDAAWSVDRLPDGIEKTYCCLSARARDFAKIGRLYMHNGDWNGRQLVPADWVRRSTEVDTSNGSADFYQYQWWIMNPGSGAFWAGGHLGQYIYVDPRRDLIIVRLGTSRGDISLMKWREFFPVLAQEIQARSRFQQRPRDPSPSSE